MSQKMITEDPMIEDALVEENATEEETAEETKTAVTPHPIIAEAKAQRAPISMDVAVKLTNSVSVHILGKDPEFLQQLKDKRATINSFSELFLKSHGKYSRDACDDIHNNLNGTINFTEVNSNAFFRLVICEAIIIMAQAVSIRNANALETKDLSKLSIMNAKVFRKFDSAMTKLVSANRLDKALENILNTLIVYAPASLTYYQVFNEALQSVKKHGY